MCAELRRNYALPAPPGHFVYRFAFPRISVLLSHDPATRAEAASVPRMSRSNSSSPAETAKGGACSKQRLLAGAFAGLLWLLLAASGPAAGAPATAKPPPRELLPWTGATPPLALNDLEGRLHELSAYRGKTVVLNFWATWCEPCREEMPSLQRLGRRFADRGLVVLTVDVGEKPDKIRRFLDQAQISLPVLLDPDGRTARSWHAVGYPASYVIGPDGSVRYHYVGALDWTGDKVKRSIERVLK
jgi:thiol-disulfide isomerase/thioredoxin